MPDIEKVKAALRCCIVRHPDDKMRCPECPYRDPTTFCLNRLKQDALELLSELGDDAISRSALLAAYDAAHQGPPGGARKLIEQAQALAAKSNTLDTMTSGECEECKIDTEQEGGADD